MDRGEWQRQTYVYDALGCCKKEIDGCGNTCQYEYKKGQASPASIIYSGGEIVWYTYDQVVDIWVLRIVMGKWSLDIMS